MNENSPTNRDTILPTDDERKRLFLWLKQISSYTAWHRVLTYYQAWANAAEHCRRLASASGTDRSSGVAESDYVAILKSVAHCEEAVLRLKAGDKRVFKFDANGKFAMAARAMSYWHKLMGRIEWGENEPITEQDTPGWNAFHHALTNLFEAWVEIGPDILEPRYLETPTYTHFGDALRDQLARMVFPTPLPDVPDPKDDILVRSGKSVPFSGIWEPVDVPKTSVFSLFRTAPPVGPFPLAGTMSYLHGGSNAPNRSDSHELDGVPATWRLLWRDTRYEDGSIPDEEQAYRFLKPEPIVASDQAASPGANDTLLWTESGQPAPQSGRWLAENDLQVSITANAGDVLPLHQGRVTRWILEQG